MSKADRRDDWRRWIDTVKAAGRDLTPWEIDFIDSIDDQLEGRRTLSDSQVEVLERIYAEKTP